MTNTIGRREKLEACPFCGGVAAHGLWEGNVMAVRCFRCGAQGAATKPVPEVCIDVHPYIDEAYRLWNRRAALSSPPAGEEEPTLDTWEFGTGALNRRPPSAGEEKTGGEALARAAERVLRCDIEAPDFGICDQIDNDGQHYKSADLDAALIDLRLALSPTSGGGAGERYYSAAEIIEASKRLTTSSVRPAPTDLPMPTYIYQPLDMTGGQSSDASKVYRPTSDAAPSSPEVIGDSE